MKAIYRNFLVNRSFLEATVEIEPTMMVLQTLASPVATGQIIYNSGRLRPGKWNSPVELQ